MNTLFSSRTKVQFQSAYTHSMLVSCLPKLMEKLGSTNPKDSNNQHISVFFSSNKMTNTHTLTLASQHALVVSYLRIHKDILHEFFSHELTNMGILDTSTDTLIIKCTVR
jgi:hypothetical protein